MVESFALSVLFHYNFSNGGMMYYSKIRGQRLYLSPMNPEDHPTYMDWISDFKVSLGLGNFDQVISLPMEKTIMEEMAQDRKNRNFAIVSHQAGLIGNCGLFSISERHRNAELGIFIGEEAHRNQGYGQEAMILLLHYGFDVLNLHSIYLYYFSFNQGGEKAYQRLGFSLSGRRREAFLLKDKYYDVIQMDLLAREFRASQHYNPDWLNAPNYAF